MQGQKRAEPKVGTAAGAREAEGAPGARRPEPRQTASPGAHHLERAGAGDNAAGGPARTEEPCGGRRRFPAGSARFHQPGVSERACQTARHPGRRRLLEVDGIRGGARGAWRIVQISVFVL